MSLDDYVHRRANKKDKQPSGLQKTIAEHRLGLWIPTGIFAVAVAVASLPPHSGDYSVENPPAVRQEAEAPKEEKLIEENVSDFSCGLEFKLFYSPQKEWKGVKIRLERDIMNDWARYAPVKITIPELSYVAPFPVDDGANSAETTFPSPAPSSGTYHYIIFGWKNGVAKELYRQVIFPKR